MIIGSGLLLAATILTWPDPIPAWFSLVVMIYALIHFGILWKKKGKK
jgi:hypothetical protein